MNRLSLAAPVLAALFAFAVHAQDAQKPEAKPAAEADKGAPAVPGLGKEPDPKIIEDLMSCLAEGLPAEWQRAWILMREISRDKTGKTRDYGAIVYVATDPNDRKGKRLQTCGPEKILEGVGKLNDYLPPDQQRWTGATFTFYRDGRFEASYDYTQFKPAAKPAAKAPAKKKQETPK